MLRKLDDVIIYRDSYYYLAFPSCVTLTDDRVLITCRRALDPRYLLPQGTPGELSGWYSHVEARSHNAMVVLDRSLRPTGPPRTVPMNPQAADQDGSLLRLADGRILLAGFSWYPFPPPFEPSVAPTGWHHRPPSEELGPGWIFWGGFTRYSDDDGVTWSHHNYLPAMPGAGDLVPGKRRVPGGAIRGTAVESEGEVLLPVYGRPDGMRVHDAYLYVCHDDGETWEYRTRMAHDAAGRVSMGEPALYRCPSGRLVCFIRTRDLEDHLATVDSTDNGRTWSEWQRRDVVGHPYTPVGLPDGRLLLVYGYRHPPFGVRARLSDGDAGDLDDAEEFVIRDDGSGPDLGYPWACVLADGTVLVVYYMSDPEGVRHIAGSVLELS
jgi:hypothetical protein